MPVMKLHDYMKLKDISDDAFAAKLGKDRTIVGRYRRGIVIPPLDVLAQIESLTDRAVSFRDFLPGNGKGK
jgi:transcriptional regulator with XRE-family HTH domain